MLGVDAAAASLCPESSSDPARTSEAMGFRRPEIIAQSFMRALVRTSSKVKVEAMGKLLLYHGSVTLRWLAGESSN